MDERARQAVLRLAQELAATQADVRSLQRGARRPQLGYSSIESGALEVRDPVSHVPRMKIGWQPDGSVAMVAENGDPPPAPSAPVAVPALAGLAVTWDGSFSGAVLPPADFDHVTVHVSEDSGFTPDASTLVGTLHRPGTLPVVPLETGTTYYLRFVGINTSGVAGPAGDQTAAVPDGVGSTLITDGSITTPKLAAGSITAAKLEAVLTLSTMIVAGTLGAARVEMDEGGLRGYDASDALIFAIDTAVGNAVFTGDITGSTISASTAMSTGFSNDTDQGILGWRLQESGAVEIRDLTVGNDLFSITSDGQAAFQQVSAEEIFVAGEALSAGLASAPRGVLQVVELSGNSAQTTVAGPSNNVLFLRAVIPAVEDREYVVTLHNAHIDMQATTPTYVGLRAFATYNAAASTTDTLVATLQSRSSGASTDHLGAFSFSITPATANIGQDLNLAFYVYAQLGSAIAGDGVRVQAEDNGASRLVIEDAGPSVMHALYDISVPGGGGGGGGSGDTSTYVTTYDPVWSATWATGTGKRLVNHAYQGRYDSTQGTQYAKWGYPTQIQTDLAGATVDKVELYMSNEHTWANAGVDAMIGTHATASEPAGSSSTSGTFDRTRIHWNRGQAKWVTLGVSTFGADLKSGAALGVTIGDPSSGDLSHYAYFIRFGTGHPKLRITYRK